MMTPLEWFAFVILPATLAVVALGASRLFDQLHPIPKESESSLANLVEELRATVAQAEARAEGGRDATDDRPRAPALAPPTR
jgi:hypothetical protein